MAWRTELLLDFTAASFEDDEMVRVANHWAIVQLYYIFYHATQALAQAKGQPRTPSHPATQKTFKAHWADRNIDLAPWSLARATSTVRNWPPSVPLEDVHVWAACDSKTAWVLAAKALRTTRDFSVKEALAQARVVRQRSNRKMWRDQEAQRVVDGRKARREPTFPLPQLSKADKHSEEGKVRATTVMDYLYRLRIGTNYEDSTTFIEGPQEPSDSLSVRHYVRKLGAATMLIHELAIADLLGAATVVQQAKAILKTTASPAIASRLSRRIEQIEAHRT